MDKAAEYKQQAEVFLRTYYKTLNKNPLKLYALYAKGGTLSWQDLQGEFVTIETNTAIKEFLPGSSNMMMKYKFNNFCVQEHSSGLLVVVDGVCEGADLKCSFAQTLILQEQDGTHLICNDALVIHAPNAERSEPGIFKITSAEQARQQLGEPQEKEESELAVKGKGQQPDKEEGELPEKGEGEQLGRSSRRVRMTSKKLTSAQQEQQEKEGELPEKGEGEQQGRRSSRVRMISKKLGKLGDYLEVGVPKSNIPSEPLLEEDTEDRKSIIQKTDMRRDGAESEVCVVFDEAMSKHKPQYYCAEHNDVMIKHKAPASVSEAPNRITSIMKTLRRQKVLPRVTVLKPTRAHLDDIQALHSSELVGFINKLPLTQPDAIKYKAFYTGDMFCSAGTPEAVHLAAGSAVMVCKAVAQRQYKRAFALVRPPGHHAGKSLAEGFCYLNNIAIGATNLLKEHDVKKILIVDWDVHHGNSTEKFFYDTANVLFISTYNDDLGYPEHRKGFSHIGEKKGLGYNINVPLKSFGNADLVYVFNELLLPVAKEYNPEIILISAGFDAAIGDIGNCNVSASCFATLLHKLKAIGTGRIVMVLEGGYKLDILSDCVSHCIRSLLDDEDVLLEEDDLVPDATEHTRKIVLKVKRAICKYWEVFKHLREK